jgi:hypothetical protein
LAEFAAGSALVTAFRLPGGSFLPLWPLLFGLLGLATVSRETKAAWRRLAWLALTALPTLFLAAPAMYEAYVALGPGAAFIPMLVLALPLGALSVQVEAVSRAWQWTLPVAGVLLALAAVVAA